MIDTREIMDLATLRQSLKQWEKSFAAANGGRKPSRDDIRNDASVSEKYREYDLLRKASAVRPAVETPRKAARTRDGGSVRKRPALRERCGNAISATSQNMKDVSSLKVIDEEQTLEPTPAFIRSGLGPTPQKDGRVLGIFDMIPSATPSRSSLLPTISEAGQIAGTPSKRSAPPSSEPCLSRTPQSSSKRRYLEVFEGTPMKRRRLDDAPTSSSNRKLFATPTFLRRSFPLAPVAEDDSNPIGMAPPHKKRGMLRSLSSIIQGLRKEEERRMDDEWEVMNELEAEECGQPSQSAVPKLLVEDSQVFEMPLGPDFAPLDSGDEAPSDTEALDANGRPRKVWKKKGLKRQTRRTNMRPVLHKPKKATDVKEHEGEEADENDVVPETQAHTEGDPCDDEEDSSHEDDGDHHGAQSNKKAYLEEKAKKKAEELSSKPEKQKKKVSAQAHANYRTLKIKNKNSKGKGGGGRFGRR